MNDTVELCVEHHGETKCFEAVFSQFGFSYRITIDVRNNPVIFEPDEERNWRARVENGAADKETLELIPLLAAQLHELL